MKHISVILLDIIEQQFQLQTRLSEHEALIRSLSDSPSINVLASIPQFEADLCALNSLHGRINQRISAASQR